MILSVETPDEDELQYCLPEIVNLPKILGNAITEELCNKILKEEWEIKQRIFLLLEERKMLKRCSKSYSHIENKLDREVENFKNLIPNQAFSEWRKYCYP